MRKYKKTTSSTSAKLTKKASLNTVWVVKFKQTRTGAKVWRALYFSMKGVHFGLYSLLLSESFEILVQIFTVSDFMRIGLGSMVKQRTEIIRDNRTC